MVTPILTQARLKTLLGYDPTTGLFTWLQTTGTRQKNTAAGSKHPRGYIIISVDRKLYCAHRLVWLYEYGCFPAGEIDHINRVKWDNRRANIQQVTRSQNTQNTGLQRNNRSGHRGVGWNKQHQKWRARISVNDVCFYLGQYNTLDEAIAAYDDAASKYHTYRLQSECNSQFIPA